MGRLAIIVLVIVAGIFGFRSLTGRSDAGSSADQANGSSLEGAAVSGELITVISKGQAVDIAAHVPDKGVVIVEFMADW